MVAPVTATIVMVTINEIRICSAVIIIITVTTATTTILQTLIKPSAWGHSKICFYFPFDLVLR